MNGQSELNFRIIELQHYYDAQKNEFKNPNFSYKNDIKSIKMVSDSEMKANSTVKFNVVAEVNKGNFINGETKRKLTYE